MPEIGPRSIWISEVCKAFIIIRTRLILKISRIDYRRFDIGEKLIVSWIDVARHICYFARYKCYGYRTDR